MGELLSAKVFIFIAALLLFALEAEAASKLRPDCSGMTPVRTREICEAMAASFTWQWTGHSTLAPGYKPDLKTISKAYCRANIKRADVPALGLLRQSTDWRLESAAEWLLKILDAQEGMSSEPENSVFNPKSKSYVMRQGCSVRKAAR